MSSIFSHQTFGKADQPTIYYFAPYGSKIKRFRPHIWLLVKAKFRVVAFDYDKSILAGGNPTLLPIAIDEMTDWVKDDTSGHKVAGVFGMSLGGYIGWNIMKRIDIMHGFFCTGGVKASTTVWTRPSLAQEKVAFEKAGYAQQDLDEAWKEIDKAHEFENKKVVAIYSVNDEVTLYEEASKNFVAWQKQGTEMRRIKFKRYNHTQTIVRGLLKPQTLIRFFKEVPSV